MYFLTLPSLLHSLDCTCYCFFLFPSGHLADWSHAQPLQAVWVGGYKNEAKIPVQELVGQRGKGAYFWDNMILVCVVALPLSPSLSRYYLILPFLIRYSRKGSIRQIVCIGLLHKPKCPQHRCKALLKPPLVIRELEYQRELCVWKSLKVCLRKARVSAKRFCVHVLLCR